MKEIFVASDFEKVDLNPRGENILAPNGNHHPAVEPRTQNDGD